MSQVDESTWKSIVGYKALAVGLVVDVDAHGRPVGTFDFVWTANGDWTSPSLEAAARRAGVARWQGQGRQPRGPQGAPGDAEQIMIDGAESTSIKIVAVSVTRTVCDDCRRALADHLEGPVAFAEVIFPKSRPTSSANASPVPAVAKPPVPVKAAETETVTAPQPAIAKPPVPVKAAETETVTAPQPAIAKPPVPVKAAETESAPAPQPAVAAKESLATATRSAPPKQAPPGLRATKAEIEPFRLPQVDAGHGGPGPGGVAAEGMAQLLTDWEHFESMHSQWKEAALASAARTLQWWASKGVYPKAYAIQDRFFEPDERMAVMASGLGTVGEMDGLEVNAPDADGIKEFERWATAHLRSYDDYVRYVLSDPDPAIIRDSDGKWLIREWKWGDWWPASTYHDERPNDQLTRFMEPLYQGMIGQTASDLASSRRGSSSHPLGRPLGVRKFKGGDRKDLYSPTEPDLRLIYAYTLDRSATFVELDASTMIPEYAAIPPEHVLVTGGDFSTYKALRESLIRVTLRHPTIGVSSPQVRVPNIHAVALVRRDALE